MNLLKHPLSRNLDIDNPQTTVVRKQIIVSKPFLTSIYCEWYQRLGIPSTGTVVELGSGGGFLSSLHPNVIMTEVFHLPHISTVADATRMPFRSGSVRMFALVDVFHHIPDVQAFLSEAERCLENAGEIVMIEPWNTKWSALVYRYLHPEPFEPSADWTIPKTGPLSGANSALPWIVFDRDKYLFTQRFPKLTIETIKLLMPASYLLSGGVSMRSLAPGMTYSAIRLLENQLPQSMFAMFAMIRLIRK